MKHFFRICIHTTSMSGGGATAEHLLTCKSFCRDMQNLKLFSSISFYFGHVYYSVVALPALWSDEKNTFLAVSKTDFYLHSAVRMIWHKFLSTMTQTRELFCLKTNLIKTSQWQFSAKSMTVLTRWPHTFSPVPVPREGRNRQEWCPGLGSSLASSLRNCLGSCND